MVATQWQQYSTHLHTDSTQNGRNNVQNNTKIMEECVPYRVFTGLTLPFALQLRKKHGKPLAG